MLWKYIVLKKKNIKNIMKLTFVLKTIPTKIVLYYNAILASPMELFQ